MVFFKFFSMFFIVFIIKTSSIKFLPKIVKFSIKFLWKIAYKKFFVDLVVFYYYHKKMNISFKKEVKKNWNLLAQPLKEKIFFLKEIIAAKYAASLIRGYGPKTDLILMIFNFIHDDKPVSFKSSTPKMACKITK